MNILLISSRRRTRLCYVLRFLLVNIGKEMWVKVQHMVLCPLTYPTRSAVESKHVECGMFGILNGIQHFDQIFRRLNVI